MLEFSHPSTLRRDHVNVDSHFPEHTLQLSRVVVVVESQRRWSDDVRGRPLRFLGLVSLLLGRLVDVESDDLLECAIRRLHLVDAVVVDVREDDVAHSRVAACIFDEALEVLLEDGRRARGREQDEVRQVFCSLSRDSLHHLGLGTFGEHVSVDDGGCDWREVALALEHGSEHVEVVVTERGVHDGVHVLERRRDAQRSDVRRSGVHPVRELHGASRVRTT
mmetsp:Transcript_6521/g.14853  ORF Transcript_6521/g.14853 Transcript_6521/m.14853 type:complete len:221 (+) Transcript_6521:2016-2678(+)